MAEVHATGHYTLRAIADAFGVHEATVSRILRRLSTLLEAGS
jgi:DNA-binding MurR/RpiR family transcriptional regulator